MHANRCTNCQYDRWKSTEHKMICMLCFSSHGLDWKFRIRAHSIAINFVTFCYYLCAPFAIMTFRFRDVSIPKALFPFPSPFVAFLSNFRRPYKRFEGLRNPTTDSFDRFHFCFQICIRFTEPIRRRTKITIIYKITIANKRLASLHFIYHIWIWKLL